MKNNRYGSDNCFERGRQTARVFKLAMLLSRRGYTTYELAEKFGVCNRTIRRDLQVLELAGVPSYDSVDKEDYSGKGKPAMLWHVDKDFMRRFI